MALTDEKLLERARACETADDLLEILRDESDGFELADEELEGVAGGSLLNGTEIASRISSLSERLGQLIDDADILSRLQGLAQDIMKADSFRTDLLRR